MITNNPPPDWQHLVRENGSLRAIIAELLIANQQLRWELLGYRTGPAHDPCCVTESQS
jgi:hypothetical protein